MTLARTWYALAALITATTVAAPAATAGEPTTAPETFLVLGIAVRGEGQFVTLRCDPPSGTHPLAEAACKALVAAGGDLDKVVGKPDTLCPASYDPVTATASGSYQGTKVLFRRSYSNPCDLAKGTAPVFQFR
ncbi:MAG: SSI family serine proteinase inhibitor [Pseudonocardiaceae bacterium]